MHAALGPIQVGDRVIVASATTGTKTGTLRYIKDIVVAYTVGAAWYSDIFVPAKKCHYNRHVTNGISDRPILML